MNTKVHYNDLAVARISILKMLFLTISEFFLHQDNIWQGFNCCKQLFLLKYRWCFFFLAILIVKLGTFRHFAWGKPLIFGSNFNQSKCLIIELIFCFFYLQTTRTWWKCTQNSRSSICTIKTKLQLNHCHLVS